MSEKKPENPELAAEATEDDEPAFEWMKPRGRREEAAASRQAPAAEEAARAEASEPVRAEDGAAPAAPATDEPAKDEPAKDEAAKEAPDAGASAVEGAGAEDPTPTSMLSVRPPAEESQRRAAERDQAAQARPVLPRVMQVLLAVFFPLLTIIGAIRAVTTPLFLWVEYHRPGFPSDSYGFSLDDRMTYGSYGVDYLVNFAGPRYLGDLVGTDGKQLFTQGEVSHMADVKSVIGTTFLAGTVLLVAAAVIIIYLLRRSNGGVRRGLFGGAIATLLIVLLLGVLGFIGWEQFFTDLHRLFFAQGTWTFYLDDALIRLYPGQFWMDAGLVIGVLVLLVSLVTIVLTWPTRRRRERSARSRNPKAARRSA